MGGLQISLEIFFLIKFWKIIKSPFFGALIGSLKNFQEQNIFHL